MKQKNAFHSPLHTYDTENQTFGCRHTDPDICARHYLPEVCAFCRDDGFCITPPKSWKKQYKKLKEIHDNLKNQ